MMSVKEAVDAAYDVGMFQHRDEIEPFAEFVAELKPRRVLEIGMLHGGTATLWHALASEAVTSIDLPEGLFGGAAHGYNEARCRQRNADLRQRLPRWKGVLGNSHSREMENIADFYDLLFVDGDHSLPGVTMDFATYRPWVRPGGWIAFHDIKDTSYHRETGCYVHDLWAWIKFTFPDAETREFLGADTTWGGIGAIRV